MSVSSRPTLLFVLSSVHRCIIRSNKSALSSHPSVHRLVFQQNVGSNAHHHNISYSTAPSSHIITPSTILRPGRQHTSTPIYQSSSSFHTLRPCGPTTSSLFGDLVGGHATTCNIRCKSKKKQYDSGEESDSDLDDNLDEDDFEAPTQFKVQTIHTPSLRIDAVLSKALGLGRNRLEEIFFGSGILLNGSKLLKKGGKMDEGDYVDVVMEKAGDQIKVKRVKLLKVGSQRTGTDKLIVRVRIWKAPFFINKPNQWTPQS